MKTTMSIAMTMKHCGFGFAGSGMDWFCGGLLQAVVEDGPKDAAQ